MDDCSSSSHHKRKKKYKESSHSLKKHKKDTEHRHREKKKKKKKEKRSNTSVHGESTPTLDLQDIQVDQDYSFDEVVELVRRNLEVLLPGDPLLSDLSPDVTVEELRALIAREHGQAIKMILHRQDGTILPVIIAREATVADLKRIVQRVTQHHLDRSEKSGMLKRNINWKHVWKTYWLSLDEGRGKLKDDQAKLLPDFGIKEGDQLFFVKRLQEKLCM